MPTNFWTAEAQSLGSGIVKLANFKRPRPRCGWRQVKSSGKCPDPARAQGKTTSLPTGLLVNVRTTRLLHFGQPGLGPVVQQGVLPGGANMEPPSTERPLLNIQTSASHADTLLLQPCKSSCCPQRCCHHKAALPHWHLGSTSAMLLPSTTWQCKESSSLRTFLNAMPRGSSGDELRAGP